MPAKDPRGGARYRVAGGLAEVGSRRARLRLALATPGVLWAPRLAGLLLPRLRARLPAHGAERRWARFTARALGLDVDIEGAEHIDPGTPYVVVALHESAVDPVALLHLPLDLRFVVRDEIFTWPYFGRYLRASGQIEVRPEAGAAAYRRMLRRARDAFDASDSVVIFPQGTLLGIEAGFQRGAFHLARQLRRPVLPVVLTGGYRVWEHPFNPRLRLGGRIGMRVLPSVSVELVTAHPPADLAADLQTEMKRHALDGSMPAPRRFDPDRDGYWTGYRYIIDPAYPELAARVAAQRAGRRIPGDPVPPRRR